MVLLTNKHHVSFFLRTASRNTSNSFDFKHNNLAGCNVYVIVQQMVKAFDGAPERTNRSLEFARWRQPTCIPI